MTVIRRVTADNAASVRMIVEPVLVGDVTLLRIGRSSLNLGYVPARPAAMQTFPPEEHLDFSLALSEKRTALFAAFEEDACIGTALVRAVEDGWGDVLDIRVAAACCRKGVGRALLGACEAFAARAGCPGLHLAISDGNPGACQFAEKCGFTLQGFDRCALQYTRNERTKPLAARAALLHLYRNKKG